MDADPEREQALGDYKQKVGPPQHSSTPRL